MHTNLFSRSAGLAFAWTFIIGAGALAAPLKYQFNGMTNPVYHVSIAGELPDEYITQTGDISYTVKSIDGDGNITVTYNAQLNTNHQKKQDDNNNNGGFPGPPPLPFFGFPQFPSSDAEIVITPAGTVLSTNRTSDQTQLIFGMGQDWQLLLQPLSSDGKTSWQTDRDMVVYFKKPQQQHWPPMGPPWQQQQPEERTDMAAHETLNFSIASTSGSDVTINKQIDFHTEQKSGDQPVDQRTGGGTIVFDSNAGLVKSMDLKLNEEVNADNVSIKIPVIVTVRLLTPEEMAKRKADQDAADAKAKAEQAINDAKAQRDQAFNDAKAQHDQAEGQQPDGTFKTASVGGDGGGPFTRCDPGKIPVVGVNLRKGGWGGRMCLGEIDPVYNKSDPAPDPSDWVQYLARDGYIVGGLITKGNGHSPASVRVIFVRMNNGQVDASDSYFSPWFGEPDGDVITQLGGHGEKVLGFYGRQGMNQDAVGLIVDTDKADRPRAVGDDTPLASSPQPDTSAQNAEIPDGASKTVAVGGEGGDPFMKCDPQKTLMIGAAIKLDDSSGKQVVCRIDPIYTKPTGFPADGAVPVFARDGYAVGAIFVSGNAGVSAVRIMFARNNDGQLDPKDRYFSHWYGQIDGPRTQLAGHGEKVIGLYGRQDTIVNALGLIIVDTADDSADAPDK